MVFGRITDGMEVLDLIEEAGKLMNSYTKSTLPRFVLGPLWLMAHRRAVAHGHRMSGHLKERAMLMANQLSRWSLQTVACSRIRSFRPECRGLREAAVQAHFIVSITCISKCGELALEASASTALRAQPAVQHDCSAHLPGSTQFGTARNLCWQAAARRLVH